MSVAPTQSVLQVAGAESPAVSTRSAEPAKSLIPAAARAPESSSPAPAPSMSSPSPMATDLRIDSQHEFYYEFVDDSTGSVVFEIPPEALRAIGESLNLPVDEGAGIHSVDVKS